MAKVKVLLIGPQPPSIGGIASYIRDLIQALNENNVEIFSVKPYVLNSFTATELLLKIYAILFNVCAIVRYSLFNKHYVTHVHTSSQVSFFENSLYILVIKHIFNKRIIIHIHAPDFETFLSSTYFKYIIKYILSICDTIIVLSNYWARSIEKELSNGAKLAVIPNAASAQFFSLKDSSIRAEFQISPSTKMIFSYGNLIERKGFHYLIDSLYILFKNNMDFICLIGGTGKMEASLKEQISRLKLENHVKLVGYIDSSRLNVYINNSDIVVLPSLNEGLPIVLFEAFNCGKPVVSTNVGGIPDIIISEKYGLLADPANAKDLSDKITVALNSTWIEADIIDYANNFKFNVIADKLTGMYRDILEADRSNTY